MKNLWISLKITLAMCIVLGVGYVLVLRGISAVAGPNGGEADVVTLDGQVITPEDYFGDLMGNISGRRGTILGTDDRNGAKRMQSTKK